MVDVVFIYGPTAVGKSDIAIELAKLIDGEIISADCIQIYKKLDIGSAKVKEDEMHGIPHHLLDFIEPDKEYSVAEFCVDAKNCIEQIRKRKKVPIIVGGTGLYFKSLINGYNFSGVAKNEDFRNSLNNKSNEEIYEEIMKIDSNVIIDKDNRQRLIRKLEILKFQTNCNVTLEFPYSYKLFSIIDDRQDIYDRINNRVDKMLQKGLIEELKSLINIGLTEENQSMKAIAYKEFFPYIKGEKTLDECALTLKQKSRNYAKRQFTFMNQFDSQNKVQFVGIKETANEIFKLLQTD